MPASLDPSEALPAFAVGSGISLLGVVRTLGRQGIPVLATTTPGDFVASTRLLPPEGRLRPLGTDEPLADYLRALPIKGAVLIPCSDRLSLEAARLEGEVTARFPTYQAPSEVLELFVDKGRFLAVLEEHSIPHPRTFLVDKPEDLRDVRDDELATAFIKPRDSQRFQHDFGVKGFHPADRAGFRSLLHDLIERGHRLMIQDYVPGPARNHYLIDGFAYPEGEIMTLFSRQRLRMYPLDFGNSSFIVAVPPDRVGGAIESLSRLLSKLRYRGIFSAEFKLDPRDGVFRLLEVNTRPWWYVEFAAREGVDVVTAVYRAALGLDPREASSQRSGRTLIYPYYDYQACLAESGGRLPAAFRLVRDLIGARQPVFSWDDPMPAIRHWVRRAPGIVARRLSILPKAAPPQVTVAGERR